MQNPKKLEGDRIFWKIIIVDLAKQASITTVPVITTMAWKEGAVDSAPYNIKSTEGLLAYASA